MSREPFDAVQAAGLHHNPENKRAKSTPESSELLQSVGRPRAWRWLEPRLDQFRCLLVSQAVGSAILARRQPRGMSSRHNKLSNAADRVD